MFKMKITLLLTLAATIPTAQMSPANGFKMNSLRCIEYDRSIAKIDYCTLKPVNRTLKLMSIRVILLKPVFQAQANFQIFKKANGYKPFPVNVTLEFCHFLAGKKYPLFDWVYDMVKPYTNVNHSCPLTSDVIIKNFPFKDQAPSVFPDGDYRIVFMVYIQQKLLGKVTLDITISENVFPLRRRN